MGCDIHMVVERRWEGRWVGVCVMVHGFNTAEPQRYDLRRSWPAAIERNYDRFAALASVRGSGPREPRGLPEDASDTSRLLFQTIGDHTPSWLPLAEAAEVFAKTERYTMRDIDREYPVQHYFAIDPENDGPIEDHRLVFWFDS